MNPGSRERVDSVSLADGVDAASVLGLVADRTAAGPEPAAEKTVPAHILAMQRGEKRKSRRKFTVLETRMSSTQHIGRGQSLR